LRNDKALGFDNNRNNNKKKNNVRSHGSSTMTATNNDHYDQKHVFCRRYDCEFAVNSVILKSASLVFHVFIAVAVMI